VPQLFILLIVLAVLSAAMWYGAQSLVVFKVKVVDGFPRVARGKVAQPFLSLIYEVCAEHNVRSATIRGVAMGRRVSLRFSRTLPTAAQQQLRNGWVNSTWRTR
jgi:Protein of unknown function (DUF3634)